MNIVKIRWIAINDSYTFSNSEYKYLRHWVAVFRVLWRVFEEAVSQNLTNVK